ncbi:PRTRC system protein B [Mucilaginibacter celer]|uniref:PRTRC system protein B n=1 Tax=Mucilaginibacter celer TaxID=2305508 RepID=A0A494VQ10_9SPHI|nr:PRTRC system protein B [Mucilaginibacter celer]AYL95280.1 PRTRC system protein B [Mucilaginibacter celer]
MTTNITNNISHTYTPFKALLIYAKSKTEEDNHYGTNEEIYVESYDISKNGRPVNAHPLSAKESILLADILNSGQDAKNTFLKCRGIIPPNVLSINSENDGYAVWYTPPMERQLFFVERLGIPSLPAKIPAMIWKAGRESLQIFAVKGCRKPHVQSLLYHAPYFNMHPDGRVCMGSVRINIGPDTSLEDFISLWERYFFNSYFSHTIDGGSKVSVNIVQLWQEQGRTLQKFPENYLVKTGLTLQKTL